MKRIIAMVCGLTLIFCVCGAFGETAVSGSSIRDLVTTEQQQAKPFSFRNGVSWAMNQQQVIAIENIPMKQSASSDWAVLISESPVQVSRFSADLVYMFKQDALRMITYEFTQDCTSLNYQYLTGALCSVYGDSREANPLIIKGWMDRIYQNYYQQDLIRSALEWTAEDGTSVFLYYFTPEKYAILYVCPTNNGASSYETTGL
ncbi:MAG: hypothetical protein ABTB30_10270 [Clostridia bacterium]